MHQTATVDHEAALAHIAEVQRLASESKRGDLVLRIEDGEIRDPTEEQLRRLLFVTRAIAQELGEPYIRQRLYTGDDELTIALVDLQGVVEAETTLAAILGPSGPRLSATSLHERVWTAAAPLWADGHHHQAVQFASQAVEAHLQSALNRFDVSGKDLANAFSTKPPTEDWPRLRIPGIEPTSSTWTSAHEGAGHLIRAAFQYVRNLASHLGAPTPSDAECLEQLAILSTLARLVDSCEVLPAEG